MVTISGFSLEGRGFESPWRILQVIGENNVSGPHDYPHIDFTWIGSSPSMCEKNNFSFLQSPISSHKAIRGHTTKK